MPGKRDVFQKRYIGKDCLSLGSALILNKDVAWKMISRRARRSILKAREIKNLEIRPVIGTKEDVDLFRTVWYNPSDSDLNLGGGGFKKNWRGWFAYLNEKFVAGTIVAEVDNILFLWFNGASEEAKRLQIPSLMLWNVVEQYHNSKFKYLDVGCSFRPQLQEFFKNWSTYEYPTIFHAPDLAPQIDITPFDVASLGIKPDKTADVDKELKNKFKKRPFTYFPRGKYAIFAALKHIGLGQDDEVFITTTTGSPYLSIGVTTTVEEVCQWSRKISDKTKAVILIHEFGFLHPKRAEIKKLCREKGWVLIEDCAYAWQSGDAGSYGDYIIYSLPKFFPVQYGGILVGAAFTDQEIWDNFYCLDVKKRDVIKEQLSSFIKSADEAAKKRADNYKYFEKLCGEEGFLPFFQLKEGEIPAAFVLKLSSRDKAIEVSERLRHFGIECGVYYHNSAVFLPIHQNLNERHLDYIYGALRSLYREGCGVRPPEYFIEITQTKKNRNDQPENNRGLLPNALS